MQTTFRRGYASIELKIPGEDLKRQLPNVQLQPEAARAEVGKSEFAEGLGEDA